MNDTVFPPRAEPVRVSYQLPLFRPLVTWILLAAIVVMFLVETAMGGSTDTQVLVRLGAKVSPLIASGEYWRMFTSMFLHIGIMHLAFNGYALVVIGTELERMFGPGRFVAIYVVSGLLGSLASYALSSSLAAGASGAIFGLIGALAAFYLLHRERLGTWGRRRLANAVFLIAINLFFGFTQPGIDNWAHLGGLVGGFGLGWAMAPRYQVEPFAGRVVDRNRLARYAPALLLATAILVLGTAGATWIQRDSPRTHLLLGQEAVEDEAWAVAAEEIQQAIDRDPSLADASAYFYLGLAHNHLDELEAAAEAYESALALEPELEPAQWNLALTYLQLGRYDNARAGFESYLRLVPDAALEVQPYLDELDRLQSG